MIWFDFFLHRKGVYCFNGMIIFSFLGDMSLCISVFFRLILDRDGIFVHFGIAVKFLLKDAAKKSFSSFPHIIVIVPLFEIGQLLDPDLYFFGSLKITLKNTNYLVSMNKKTKSSMHTLKFFAIGFYPYTIFHFLISP